MRPGRDAGNYLCRNLFEDFPSSFQDESPFTARTRHFVSGLFPGSLRDASDSHPADSTVAPKPTAAFVVPLRGSSKFVAGFTFAVFSRTLCEA